MKEMVLQRKKSVIKKYALKFNSIKVKIITINIAILLLLFIFFTSSSLYLIKLTSENALETYGEMIFSNYVNNFDINLYSKFLEDPSLNNPNFIKCVTSLREFKKMIGAVFIYTMKIDESNKEVILLDSSDGELYLPPGYVLRDKPTNIVKETYKKQKFVRAQYINNSWGDYYSFYFPLKDSNGRIISLMGMDLDAKTLNSIIDESKSKNLSIILKFTYIIYILFLIITIISMSEITKPISAIKSFLKVISKGNLTEKFNYSEESNEFSSIQNLFIDMIENIKKILKSIISTSQKIDSTFLTVEAKKTDIVSKILNINSLTFNISKSNEKIFLNTNNVKDEIFSFNSSINKMSTEIYNTKEISQKTEKVCIENTENIQNFILELEPLIQKFENFKANTLLLNELSSEIKHILKGIHDIANQTKLLSLNASIVAASAGEHGDGFAVVSREIGELSYKTSQSVSLIQDTLATIIKTIFSISNETIATSKIFKEQTSKSSIFSKNLNTINDLISKISSSLENMSSQSKELTKKNDFILTSIKYINDESKANNITLKSISDSTNKLSEIAEYFRIEFKKINKYIRNIRNSYKVFKIKKEE